MFTVGPPPRCGGGRRIGPPRARVLWADPALREARRVAEGGALPAPAAGELRVARCWTAGSAVHTDDPLFRRAAWAVVWRTGAASFARAGRCPGDQTVPRAELAAVAWAAEAAAAPLEVVTDCLAHGAAMVAAPSSPDSPDAQEEKLKLLAATRTLGMDDCFLGQYAAGAGEPGCRPRP